MTDIHSFTIRPMTNADLCQALALSGYEGRSYLLSKLIEDYPEKTYYIKSSSMSDGYILGSNGSRFNYIGPLCADSLVPD